ncbi:MAG: hypothetical protein IJ770_03915 [Alphaproteobacteria bacterium]|nr:hypothetical protein [Alphaproteobacteria bacterium]
MYIWILLATIMVAMTFFNVSPRVDKEHALNEIRAATVTNRFKAEHEAMLKTMECEIMYNRNNGCWDTENRGMGCTSSTPRQSANGPVNVGCFNPGYVRMHSGSSDPRFSCTGMTNTVSKTFNGTSYSMQSFADDIEKETKKDYTSFWAQMPVGYEINPTFFPKGIYHYILCLDEVAGKATASNFIRCDMKRNTSGDNGSTGTGETGDTGDAGDTGTSGTTQKHLSARTRYLVTFARVPEKWLSKTTDDNNFRAPLPVLVNMLSKDIKTDTTYGWTSCNGNKASLQCQLAGANARNGNVVRREDSRRNQNDKKGVSIDMYAIDKKYEKNDDGSYKLDEKGKRIVSEKKYKADYVYEFEQLPRNSVFWQIPGFQEVCADSACLFAYEQFPNTDTAYHCYNMMTTGEKKKNTGVKAHGDNNNSQPAEPTP